MVMAKYSLDIDFKTLNVLKFLISLHTLMHYKVEGTITKHL
jgi:hypothetical protein